MKETEKLLVGYDLCEDFSQLGFYNEKLFEPETIKYGQEGQDDRIPTFMAVTEDKKKWLFGDAAKMAVKLKNAIPVDKILEHVKNKESYILFDKEFAPVDILSKYFRHTLLLIKPLFPNRTITQLVITIKDTDQTLVAGIFDALAGLGLERDRVSVISHAQSYTYYALSQKKELWMNDVALFDFDYDGLMYYQIKIDRQKRPITVAVKKTDYSDKLNHDSLDILYDEQLAYMFENISREALYKQIISTIYVTGIGFVRPWAQEIIKKFCVGRRGFIGQNLFSGGACYAAKNMTGEDKFADFIFLSEDMVTGTVMVKADVDGMAKEIVFVKMATPWYEADNTYEFILDDINEIELIIKNELKNTRTSHFIGIDGIPKRPNKATRIRMRVRFLSPKECVVLIKDLGFGMLYPASDRVWEKVINL